MSKVFRIAAIAGDGIGKEVLPEGLRVLEQAAKKWQLDLSIEVLDWAHCDYYLEHGQMMPEDWFEQLKGFDAIYFGAVGWPDNVPVHISLWGSLLKFRRDFDQYVNIRPVRLFPGVPCPLAGREPGDIDFVVIRENTEGEYSSVGGKMFEGTEHEFVLQESVFTRRGVDRILKFAFDLAQTRPRKRLTAATKSNGISISMPYWDERTALVASNLFGDILSDLGPACAGTIGIAPSANLDPERRFPSLFEPVHGSAPDIYGLNIANPIAMIWSGALMLDFLGNGDERYRAAHDGILQAIERVIADGPITPDLGGKGSTQEMGKSID